MVVSFLAEMTVGNIRKNCVVRVDKVMMIFGAAGG
jgi:hypothetical protein